MWVVSIGRVGGWHLADLVRLRLGGRIHGCWVNSLDFGFGCRFGFVYIVISHIPLPVAG